MSPQERLEFEEMKRTLENIKRVTDVSFIKELERRLRAGAVTIELGAGTAGTAQVVRNSTNTGTETVADQYTGVLTIYNNGQAVGRIGYYT